MPNRLCISAGFTAPPSSASRAFIALVRNASSDRSRTILAREIHTGPYETAVGPAEIVAEIRVPIRPGAGSAYEKVERRAGDWAVVSAGAAVWVADGVITDARVGLAAVSFPTIGHFLEDGFLDPAIRSLLDGVKVAGPAVTVRIAENDAYAMNRSLLELYPGAVLVVVAGANNAGVSAVVETFGPRGGPPAVVRIAAQTRGETQASGETTAEGT